MRILLPIIGMKINDSVCSTPNSGKSGGMLSQEIISIRDCLYNIALVASEITGTNTAKTVIMFMPYLVTCNTIYTAQGNVQ